MNSSLMSISKIMISQEMALALFTTTATRRQTNRATRSRRKASSSALKEGVWSHERSLEGSFYARTSLVDLQKGRTSPPSTDRRARGSGHSNSPFGEIVWHESKPTSVHNALGRSGQYLNQLPQSRRSASPERPRQTSPARCRQCPDTTSSVFPPASRRRGTRRCRPAM